MTGDARYLAWARRIGDAYVEEVLPGNFGVPSTKWDFATHTGEPQLRLRDHGNELIVGLTLLYALESDLQSDRAPRYAPVVRTHARSGPRLGQPGRHAVQPGRRADAGADRHAACRTTGATSTARSTPSTRSPARWRTAMPSARARQPAAVPASTCGSRGRQRREPAARLVRRLRRHDRERALSGEPRAGAGGARLDRDRDRAHAGDAAARRPPRGLVRRGQLQPHAAALRADEEPGRDARRARRPGCGSAPCAKATRCACTSSGVPSGPAAVRHRAPPARDQPRAELRPAERVPRVVHRRAELAVSRERRHGAGPHPARLRADAGRAIHRRRVAHRATRPAALRHASIKP